MVQVTVIRHVAEDESLASALDPLEHIVKELMIQTGDWVLVKYDNDIFPGEVKATEEGEVKVSVMIRSANHRYKWTPAIFPDVVLHSYVTGC